MPTMYVLSENIQKINIFPIKFSVFTSEQNFCVLHRRVFVMFSAKLF